MMDRWESMADLDPRNRGERTCAEVNLRYHNHHHSILKLATMVQRFLLRIHFAIPLVLLGGVTLKARADENLVENDLGIELSEALQASLATDRRETDRRETDRREAEDEEALQQFDVVFQLSKEMLEDLTRDVIEMELPIDRTIDGTAMKEHASGRGNMTIELPVSDTLAQFTMRVVGTAHGKLRSDVGPAWMHLSSHSDFFTHKTICFDGELFHDDPADAETQNRSRLDGICAKGRGLIGCLVERIGRRMARKQMADVNATAEEYTRSTLISKFDSASIDLVRELNETTQFEEVVDKYFPETRRWQIQTATRPEFLLAGAGMPTATFSFLLLERPTE